MHLIERVEGASLRERAAIRPPFGPGFPSTSVALAARMDIMGSGLNDPGPDCCLFILLDVRGNEIARRRIDGY
jgi:hypothetical protein